jgi:hypothetical protein
VDNFWLIFFCGSRDHNSFPIQRFRNYFGACQNKNSPRLMKTRIFNPNGFARIQQRHGAD